jgi:hypothetical protein
MATERAKWIRIFTGVVLRNPISDAAKLALVRLAAWLFDRSSRDFLGPEESCEATLSKGALTEITGASRRKKQLEILDEFADYEGINLVDCGDYVSIKWPNYVKYLPPARRGSGDRRADADADADVDVDVDAPGSALEEGSTRGEASNSTSSHHSAANREPVRELPDYVPEILLEFTPELDQHDLHRYSVLAWQGFNTSGAHTSVIGFRPFVEQNWPFDWVEGSRLDPADQGDPTP